jgi:predicted ABC-type ATPase
MPDLYIITGSNGAGKSSIGPDYLPATIREQGIFDGDKLFVEKRKELWRTIKSSKECGKLAYAFVTDTFDNLVETALRENRDFAYEGHFTNEATWDIPRRFRAAGYATYLYFFGLQDVELSRLRVQDRTNEGGHYVDPQTVSGNFYGNLEKLHQHYALFHQLHLIDTSEPLHRVLAVFNEGQPILALPSAELPNWFSVYLPALTGKIRNMEGGISQ